MWFVYTLCFDRVYEKMEKEEVQAYKYEMRSGRSNSAVPARDSQRSVANNEPRALGITDTSVLHKHRVPRTLRITDVRYVTIHNFKCGNCGI